MTRGNKRQRGSTGNDGDDEEEPEGDDLFDDRFVRGAGLVVDTDEEEDRESVMEDFIDDATTASEVSLQGRQEVAGLLDARDEMERRLHERRRGRIDTREADTPTLSSSPESASDGSADGSEMTANGGGRAPSADSSGSPILHLDQVAADWAVPQGSLVEWLAQDAPRRSVRSQMYHFFNGFSMGDRYVYHEAAHALASQNGQSLEVEFWHLAEVYRSVLSIWLADAPEPMLELMSEAATHFVLTLYPHYRQVHASIFARIRGLPLIDPIREFRQAHLRVLVQVEGVVVRRSPVYPKLQAVKYDCLRCGFLIGPIMQRNDREMRVSQCPSCQGRGPFRINMALTHYSNHQTVVLQESPGKVPPGRLPRSIEAVLTDDLIDRVRPGEEVRVTGIYKNNFDPLLNSRQGFPVLTTVLHANNISKKTSLNSSLGELQDSERELIYCLARHPNLKQKMIASVAPSIHGREDIKLGLLLALLGGVPKGANEEASHHLRGDINVLLLGDPGCAKSQLLKFVEKTADRAVFTTGRGSTAVGLTAAVHRDPVSGDFMLEGGALVIADRGVCLIDEFDKMSDQDRTSIHEAMEQQTISVARGGIVTTLSARCSVIAAANPIGGRYDPSQAFDANVSLTTPILSRFDLLFVLRDEVDYAADIQLASFICQSHRRNHPRTQQERVKQERKQVHQVAQLQHQLLAAPTEEERRSLQEALDATTTMAIQSKDVVDDTSGVREDDDPSSPLPLRQSLLRSYLQFAREHCTPKMTRIDDGSIPRLYTELRQESKKGGIHITVRHMESIIRLSEAHARLHLREFVHNDDVTAAIALFLRCFLGTQKYSLRVAMTATLQKYLNSDIEPIRLLLHRLRVAVRRRRVVEQHVSGLPHPPVDVEVECGTVDDLAAQVNVSREAVNVLYEADVFRREFDLVRDENGIPLRVVHRLRAVS